MSIDYHLDIFDSYGGEMFGAVQAKLNDKPVGKIEFSVSKEFVYGPEELNAEGWMESDVISEYWAVRIGIIEVVPDQRRNGIAKGMLSKLNAEFPDAEIDYGMAISPEGAELMKSVQKISKVAEILAGLNELGGQPTGSLELASTNLATARRFAEAQFKVNGRNLDQEIPNFDQNYIKAQHLASLGFTKRKDMPVIASDQASTFKKDLGSGSIDILPPNSNYGHPPHNLFPQGLTGEQAKKWLSGGAKKFDGSGSDDKISSRVLLKTVGKLKPIQSQIYFDKAITKIAAVGAKAYRIKLQDKKMAIASNDGYLIEGHHKFLGAVLLDPKIPIQVLQVDLPVHTLYPLSLAYSDAIGNQRNESLANTILEQLKGLDDTVAPDEELGCDATTVEIDQHGYV